VRGGDSSFQVETCRGSHLLVGGATVLSERLFMKICIPLYPKSIPNLHPSLSQILASRVIILPLKAP
jgi:hypothetical protein